MIPKTIAGSAVLAIEVSNAPSATPSSTATNAFLSTCIGGSVSAGVGGVGGGEAVMTVTVKRWHILPLKTSGQRLLGTARVAAKLR